MYKKFNYLILLLITIFLTGCTNEDETSIKSEKTNQDEVISSDVTNSSQEVISYNTNENNGKEEAVTTDIDESEVMEKQMELEPKSELFAGYNLISIDGGNLSGYREPNVVVDIGFGDREYWAFTNEHGQLVRVTAEEIVIQDDTREPVLSSGRYYSDEAKVPGVASDILDEGHVIADSLGGVSNAYNITPQDSTLNRHGDQAYMESVIRSAGGVTNFEAIITYPNTETQIPSSYQYTYTLMGNEIVEKFNNINPDVINATLGLTDSESVSTEPFVEEPSTLEIADAVGDVHSVDTNKNGQVTIKEAKAAGFSMPIMSDHWLYPYMRDNDNDGMVGE